MHMINLKNLLIITICMISTAMFSQTNILVTNSAADNVLKGNYNPSIYDASNVINDPQDIIATLNTQLNTDSLRSFLEKLTSFHNRNTGSDTVSPDSGIGAARRWAYEKFESFSAENENRLLVSYLQFDQDICDMGRHKNVLAVLPGSDTADHQLIIIEAHMDSRCESGCDIDCKAEGADDNGSGSVMVLELARLMSQFTFKHTIMFMLTTGEEQGLAGAAAFARYAADNDLKIKAVQNNDVVGGILCGERASPPTTCEAEGQVDSTSVRLFSFYAPALNQHRNFAKFIKLQYQEELDNIIDVPMTINIMNQEDRTGRGGDHIPFRQRGYTALRFTSAHEHGDGHPEVAGYDDHQHTVNDVIGLDTDNDMEIDSFFVDFNYLKRNSLINATSLVALASGPATPTFELNNTNEGIEVEIDNAAGNTTFKVIVSTTLTDYHATYEFSGVTEYLIPNTKEDSTYYITIAGMDENGIESLFADEEKITADADGPVVVGIEKLISHKHKGMITGITPNPTSGTINIQLSYNNLTAGDNAYIIITDIKNQVISKVKLHQNKHAENIVSDLSKNGKGLYFCSLYINGVALQSEKVVLY